MPERGDRIEKEGSDLKEAEGSERSILDF